MDLQRINKVIGSYAGYQSVSVAIRMCTTVEELPSGVKMPMRDIGFKVALCQAINTVRRFGWVMALGVDDISCSYGALTLGFIPAKKGWLDGSFDAAFSVEHRPTGVVQEDFARSAQAFPRLEYDCYKYVLMAPLEQATFEPHVIVVYGDPAHLIQLIRGRLMHQGGSLTFEVRGGAACGNHIALPMIKDECQLGMPGAGERRLAMTKDNEMFFSIPASKIESVVAGLEMSHKNMALRSNVPSTLEFQPESPLFVNKLWDYARSKSD